MERIQDMYRGFRTEIEAENTNLSNSVSGKSGGAQFADTKETHPSFAFRNILEGSIEIIKTDGTGKALQNVEFLLQYRKMMEKQTKTVKRNTGIWMQLCAVTEIWCETTVLQKQIKMAELHSGV